MQLRNHPPMSAYKSSSGVRQPGQIYGELNHQERLDAYVAALETKYGKLPEGETWAVDFESARVRCGVVLIRRHWDEGFCDLDPHYEPVDD